MAGIVDKDGNLQVTGSGGGGGNVTIVAPIPLPVSGFTSAIGSPVPANAVPVAVLRAIDNTLQYPQVDSGGNLSVKDSILTSITGTTGFGAAPLSVMAVGFLGPIGELEYGNIDASGRLKVTGAVTIADGADIVEGTIADAAVLGNSAGTISAKLRGMNAELADMTSLLFDIDLNTTTFLQPSVGAYIRQDSNATIAKESGGNLESLVSLTKGLFDLIELNKMTNALLRGIYIQLASVSNVTPNIKELTENAFM